MWIVAILAAIAVGILFVVWCCLDIEANEAEQDEARRRRGSCG